ncbi:MAG: helix-turn-helix transcriptional regulator, partial [Hungatella sp.]|nr:helix-turn-helix transcriptional regulator [Hungatella sp.]
MNQSELARIMGTARNTATNWETDKSRPEFDTIRELCTLLGIPNAGLPSPGENRPLSQYRKLSPV